MEDSRFQILFVKLCQVTSEDDESPDNTLAESQALNDELEEISELRRIVQEVTEPETPSYTST
jgi:hypothetical protein